MVTMNHKAKLFVVGEKVRYWRNGCPFIATVLLHDNDNVLELSSDSEEDLFCRHAKEVRRLKPKKPPELTHVWLHVDDLRHRNSPLAIEYTQPKLLFKYVKVKLPKENK